MIIEALLLILIDPKSAIFNSVYNRKVDKHSSVEFRGE